MTTTENSLVKEINFYLEAKSNRYRIYFKTAFEFGPSRKETDFKNKKNSVFSSLLSTVSANDAVCYLYFYF